ncbi:Palmitoyltransferase [Entamoeba marina]
MTNVDVTNVNNSSSIDEIDIYYPTSKVKVHDIHVSDKVYVFTAITLMILLFILTLYSSIQTILFKNFTWFLINMIGLFSYTLMILSYKSVCTISPGKCIGYIPSGTEQDLLAAKERVENGISQGYKTCDITEPVRYCGQCQQYKSPRTYHCKKCHCCIEKRDHHCPWVGQCVGRYNMKYFMLFLLYCQLTLLFGVIINISSMYIVVTDATQLKGVIPFHVVFILMSSGLSLALILGLLCGVFILFINYMGVCSENETSMETLEISRLLHINKSKKQKILAQIPNYDRGVINNFKEVMGQSYYEWLMPFPVKTNSLTEL